MQKFLLLLLLISATTVFAQKKKELKLNRFNNGYAVMMHGDTVEGKFQVIQHSLLAMGKTPFQIKMHLISGTNIDTIISLDLFKTITVGEKVMDVDSIYFARLLAREYKYIKDSLVRNDYIRIWHYMKEVEGSVSSGGLNGEPMRFNHYNYETFVIAVRKGGLPVQFVTKANTDIKMRILLSECKATYNKYQNKQYKIRKTNDYPYKTDIYRAIKDCNKEYQEANRGKSQVIIR